MARHKITIQPAPEAELANITHWYQETGLPPVGDTDAGIVNATFRDAHRSGLLGSALGSGVARATVMPLHPQPHETIVTRSCASSSRLDGHTIGMLVVRRAASSTGSMGNCSPITNPLRPKTAGFLMDNRDCSSRGGRETVAAQRNNTVADIRRNYRHCSAAV